MHQRHCTVLFLCTVNWARSILAEALLGVLGRDRFRAFSAGSHPAGRVQTVAAELAVKLGYPRDRLCKRSWNEFLLTDAPRMDPVITVCDNTARASCPIWSGRPVTAHRA